MSNHCTAERAARPVATEATGENLRTHARSRVHAVSAERSAAQEHGAAVGVSIGVLSIALAFFFVLCVLAAVNTTPDRFGDSTVPRATR